jgi:O-antigen/teichoic acid export membrane protein
MFKKTFRILMLISFPIVIITAFSQKKLSAQFTERLRKISHCSVNCNLDVSFIFPNILLSNIFIIANKQRLNAVFGFVCLLLNIVLNVFLIPRYGFIGSGIATVVTDAIFFMLSCYSMSYYFTDLRLVRYSIKPSYAVCCWRLSLSFLTDLI